MLMVGTAKTLRCVVHSLLIGAALIYAPKPAFAQTQQEQQPPDHAEVTPAPPAPPQDDPQAKQHKRILWIIPNYRSVSANTQLPPLTVKDKFWQTGRSGHPQSLLPRTGTHLDQDRTEMAHPDRP